MLNAEERMKRAVIKLQYKNPFFAHLALYLKIIKDEGSLPENSGMGVSSNGTLIYKEEWVNDLRDEQLIGVVCHEILHLALLHLVRLGSRNKQKHNVACDLAVNTLLLKNGFELPKGIIPDERDRYITFDENGKQIIIENVSLKTAEEIYEELPDFPDGDGEGNGGNGEGGWDIHKIGTQAENRKDEKEWRKRLSEAYTMGKMKGNLPMGLERYVEELKKSQVNWKALLQKYVQSMLPHDYTWAKRGKSSYATKLYLPSTLKEKIDVCVMMDLSGSIGKEELTDFLSEICGMAKAFSSSITFRLLTHDYEVQNDYVVANGSIAKIKKLKLNGGGGTSFENPIKYIQDKKIKPQCLIWLTDGYGDRIKKPNYPIIWVLNKDGSDELIKGTGIIIKLKNESR